MNVFTAINDSYTNMAEAAEATKTQTQLINIGLIISHHSFYHFSSDIRKRNSKPEAEKTWPTFKAHFKEAQRDIKQCQLAVTTDSLAFHDQANTAAIVNQVIERLSVEQQMQQEIQQEIVNATTVMVLAADGGGQH